MSLRGLVPPLLALGIACAGPEAEQASPEVPAATVSVPVTRGVERIEFRVDGTVRSSSCSEAIALDYPAAPPMAEEETQRVQVKLDAIRPQLKGCYVAALKSGAVRGTAKMMWELGLTSDGSTNSRSVWSCNLPDTMERCVGDALRSLRLDRTEVSVRAVRIPYRFDASPPPKEATTATLDGGALWACVQRATAARPGAKASALFRASGSDVKVDRWTGDEALLQCAAEVLQRANATFEVELVLGG